MAISSADLTGSDKAEFIFFDANGNKVLDFYSDYITSTTVSSQYPSGYKSFGPFGGDGSCVLGNCTAALYSYSTSMADNLNKLGYCAGGICQVTTPGGVVDLKVNSPPTLSTTNYTLKYPAAFPNGWNFTNAYFLTLNKSFFANGLSNVEVGVVHNSPPKAGTNAIDPVPCEPSEPGGCGLSAADPTTKDKQVKQAITNTGSAKATMTGVTVTWPSTNGKLSKVKFDGDVIWDGSIACVGTTCSATLTSSELTTDAKKKSIDPGKTRQLIFEFEKNASTNLSLYTWTVEFGSGCSVSFPPGPKCGGVIGDFVWNDNNPKNGLQDFGEPGIAGVTITLKQGGAFKATAVTDASGYYQFTGLCAGTYTVEETTPMNFTPTSPCSPDPTIANDSNCSPATVTLADDTASNLTIDFGLVSNGGVLMCPATPIAGFSGPVGALFVTVDPANGDVTVRYDQSRGLNDNSYGTNIVQWPTSHTFSNLTGSDKAQFMFYDKNGTKVLDFYLDYITTKSGTASGYASLGPDGGDGSMVSGTRSNIKAWTTSLAESLNATGYCISGNCSAGGTNLLVNSPPTVSSSSYDLPAGSPYSSWNFTNSYSVTISSAAFGTSGFGKVALGAVHNSPPKTGSNAVYPVPCP